MGCSRRSAYPTPRELGRTCLCIPLVPDMAQPHVTQGARNSDGQRSAWCTCDTRNAVLYPSVGYAIHKQSYSCSAAPLLVVYASLLLVHPWRFQSRALPHQTRPAHARACQGNKSLLEPPFPEHEKGIHRQNRRGVFQTAQSKNRLQRMLNDEHKQPHAMPRLTRGRQKSF